MVVERIYQDQYASKNYFIVHFTNSSLCVYFHRDHSANGKKRASSEMLQKDMWVQLQPEVMHI